MTEHRATTNLLSSIQFKFWKQQSQSTDIIRIKQISRSFHVYFFKLSDHISTESHKLQRHHCYCPFVYHAFHDLMSNSPISAMYLNVLVGRIDMMWRGGELLSSNRRIFCYFLLCSSLEGLKVATFCIQLFSRTQLNWTRRGSSHIREITLLIIQTGIDVFYVLI